MPPYFLAIAVIVSERTGTSESWHRQHDQILADSAQLIVTQLETLHHPESKILDDDATFRE
jgi:hypothetical protein